MATQMRWMLVDDLDGSPASATVEFGLDRRFYAIDLSAENEARLRDVLAEFVAAARVRRGTSAPTRRLAPARRTAVPAPTTVPAHITATAHTTVAAPVARPAPPPLRTELAEIVHELADDVRRALLEFLAVVLDVLRELAGDHTGPAPGARSTRIA